MVGLGFAMMENITYYMRAFEEGGTEQLGAVFILRGLIMPLSHPLFTSMTGLGGSAGPCGTRPGEACRGT